MVTVPVGAVTIRVEKGEVKGIAFLLLVGVALIGHDRNLGNVAHVVADSVCFQQIVEGSQVSNRFYELFGAFIVQEANTDPTFTATHG